MPPPFQPAHRRRLTRILAGASSLLAENRRLRQDKERAEEAHRAKSAFLASLSHQLRTPLNAIFLYGELLSEDLAARGAGDLAGDLDRIQEAGHHLLSLIDDILDLSRMEAGRMTFELQDADLPALAADLAAQFQPRAALARTTLAIQLAPGLGGLRTDPRKLAQILVNFLDNALKFTVGGQVCLAMERREEPAGVAFTVRDTGVGMPADQVARIAEAFSQTEDGQPKFGEAGLGLTLCRRLAERLGGTLQVASAPGEGSTFTLTLPAGSAP